MLNSPNEWHNEEDFDESYPEEYSDDEYSDNEYPEDEYSDDGADIYDENSSDDEIYEDEEYDDGDGGGNDGNLKKYLIIGSAILLVFLLLVGGIFGFSKMGNKNSDKDIASIEKTEDASLEENDAEETMEETDVDGETEVSVSEDGDDVSIEIENEDGDTEKPEKTTASAADENSGLEVEVEEEKPGTFTGTPGDNTVTIAIGDVGRKNPFAPNGELGVSVSGSSNAKTEGYGLDFEVIEPPELGVEREDIAKLLNTKVAGILYDQVRPSAIIKIDGVDQLIRVGDVLSGFQIIAITRNKVVIQSDNNVYRASVGQPLNAERVVNTVEISNLQSKFYGSAKHAQ